MNHHTFLSAVHLFLVKNDQILLSRRFNTGYEDGKYSLIAGHVEEDETVTQAMIREAREEAGIEILPEDLQVVHVMHRKSDTIRIDFFLLCKKWRSEPHIMEKEKCDELRWVNPKELPENTISYIKEAITQWQKGNTFSEFGW